MQVQAYYLAKNPASALACMHAIWRSRSAHVAISWIVGGIATAIVRLNWSSL